MALRFARSIHALEVDRGGRVVASPLVAAALLGLWIAWALGARLSVYEVTSSARLEVALAAHRLEAGTTGRVVASRLDLGRQVAAGDVLVELDSVIERRQLEEEKARLASFGSQLAALREELAASEEAMREQAEIGTRSRREARARHEQATLAAGNAAERASRLGALQLDGVVPQLVALETRSEAEQQRALTAALAEAADRIDWEARVSQSDRRAHISQLRRELAQLEGQQTQARESIARLGEEIERRRIRAPIAGRLGEVADLRIGAVVQVSDRLAAVVPSGALGLVGEFAPAAALGRIRAGQQAQFRLEAFPWTQFGAVQATVTNVASEVRNGSIRVELVVNREAVSPIPLQHGLPGTVEIMVDRVAPATLVFNAVGRALHP